MKICPPASHFCLPESFDVNSASTANACRHPDWSVNQFILDNILEIQTGVCCSASWLFCLSCVCITLVSFSMMRSWLADDCSLLIADTKRNASFKYSQLRSYFFCWKKTLLRPSNAWYSVVLSPTLKTHKYTYTAYRQIFQPTSAVIAPRPVMCSFMLICQCCFAIVKVLLKKVTYLLTFL